MIGLLFRVSRWAEGAPTPTGDLRVSKRDGVVGVIGGIPEVFLVSERSIVDGVLVLQPLTLRAVLAHRLRRAVRWCARSVIAGALYLGFLRCEPWDELGPHCWTWRPRIRRDRGRP